jgi:hypothetical protein
MTLSRRKMLALVGGGTILAAAGAATAFLSTRTPHRALAPWSLAGCYGGIRRDALSWALLAPNPHNLQPWLAELAGEDRVILHRDPARDLPHTDPFARQLTIGMGCFIELMEMAAAQAGHGVTLDLFPDGDAGPVAHATFIRGADQRDPLFAAAADRRSCKEPFEDRAVPPADATALAGFADIHTDPQIVETLKALTWRAWQIEMQTPRTWKESVDLLRIGKVEIEANPYGIDLSGPMFDVLGPLGIITRENQLPLDGVGARQTLETYRTMLNATPAHAVIRTSGNSRADQIEAGRRWLRLNLAATARGLSLQPVSQALQEYPEMAQPYADAHSLLAKPGETVQMLGRLGYGPRIAQTPRWPLETKLRNA